MGQIERAQENKRANRRERAKESRGRRAASAASADWANFNWLGTAILIECFAEHDGAVRVGKTRDGGAWAFGCYMGDDYATEYVRPSEDFDTALSEIAAAWLPDGGARFFDRLLQSRENGLR